MTPSDIGKQLQKAAEKGDLDQVKDLVFNHGANIFYNHNNVLFMAAANGHIPVVDFLLCSPEIPVHSDDDRTTECYISGEVGCNDSEHKCITKYSDAKEIALVEACRYGASNVVRYLLTHDKFSRPVNIHYNLDEALCVACAGSQINIARFLLYSVQLQEHADITACNNLPIKEACGSSWPNSEMLRLLLKHHKLDKHADIYANDCAAFKELFNKSYLKEKSLMYLIYEYKMQLMPSMKEFLIEKQQFEVLQLFESRDLYNTLNKDLPITSKTVRKSKI